MLLACSTIACSPKVNQKPGPKATEEPSEIINIKIPTTKYMEYLSTETQVIEGKPFTVRTYTVKEGDLENFILDYEKILNKAGWTTVYKLKPNYLHVIKDDDEIIVLPYSQSGKLILKVIIDPKAKE